MPLNRTFAGVWSMGWDPYANALIICENISHQYNLSVSAANVMGGSGNMLIKDIGNADPQISIKGPMLFSSVLSGGYAPSWKSPINGTAVTDAFIYSSGITKTCWDSIFGSLTSDTFLSSDVVLNSTSLDISDQGANVSTSWYLDYLSENPGYVSDGRFPTTAPSEAQEGAATTSRDIGEPWLTDNVLNYPSDLVPLRKGTWYDFVIYASLTDRYYVVKDYSIKITPEYDTLNLIGGYRHPNAAASDMFWHVPIRIFKGAKVSVELTSMIPINFGYPGWGRANLSYWGPGQTILANQQRISTQAADFFTYPAGHLQVNLRYPSADSWTGLVGENIASALLSDSSGNHLEPVGYLTTATSSDLNAGICTSKLSFEYLLRPPSL